MSCYYYASLRQTIARKLINDQFIRKDLAVDSIYWEDPSVIIQTELLEREFPLPTVTKRRKSPSGSKNSLETQRKQFVGGRKILNENCSGAGWSPGEKWKLFHLQKGKRGNFFHNYFLLLKDDEYYFLLKSSGERNRLDILEENEHPPHFGSTLQALLNWEWKNKEM